MTVEFKSEIKKIDERRRFKLSDVRDLFFLFIHIDQKKMRRSCICAFIRTTCVCTFKWKSFARKLILKNITSTKLAGQKRLDMGEAAAIQYNNHTYKQ